MSLSLSLGFFFFISEQNIEREVLHSQCRKLEAQHYNLSLTAEQVSHSMGVSVTPLRQLFSSGLSLSISAEPSRPVSNVCLSVSSQEMMTQKQKLAAEREKLQAELEHFRKCLSVPHTAWSRAHFKGYPPR